jgi:MFS family permease
VKALAAVSFLTDAHSETILPLLPLFLANVLRVDMKFIGLIEGVSGAVTSILQGLSGRISDMVGRRKALVTAGYTLSSVSKLVLSFAQSGGQVFAVRLADRCGKGVRTSPRDALIAESSVAKARGAAFGFHRMMDTAGALVGAAAAIFLMKLFQGNMRTVFLWAAVPGFLAVLTCMVFVRETPHAMPAGDAAPGDGAPMSAALKRFLLVNSLFCLGDFSYQFFMLRSQSLGVAMTAILAQYLVYNAVYSATAVPVGHLSDRMGRKWFLAGAYVSYAMVALLFAAAGRPWHAWVLFPLYGIHCGVFQPVSRAYVSDLATRNRMGTAMGLYHMTMGFATLVASSVAGLLWDRFGPQAAFVYGASLAGAAFVMLLVLRPEAQLDR